MKEGYGMFELTFQKLIPSKVHLLVSIITVDTFIYNSAVYS